MFMYNMYTAFMPICVYTYTACYMFACILIAHGTCIFVLTTWCVHSCVICNFGQAAADIPRRKMLEVEELPAELQELHDTFGDESLPSADRKQREEQGNSVREQQRDIKAVHREEMKAKARDAATCIYVMTHGRNVHVIHVYYTHYMLIINLYSYC